MMGYLNDIVVTFFPCFIKYQLNQNILENLLKFFFIIFICFTDVDTIVATSKLTTKTAQSGMNTAQSLTLKAEVSYNDNDSNISTIATIIAFSSERDLKVKICKHFENNICIVSFTKNRIINITFKI